MMEWLVALALIVGVFYMLSREHKRMQSRTEEEYQRDVEAAGKSLTGAALFELQKTLQPEARSGIEYVMDQKQGMTEEEKKADDSPDGGESDK